MRDQLSNRNKPVRMGEYKVSDSDRDDAADLFKKIQKGHQNSSFSKPTRPVDKSNGPSV